ncbi:hypothetical protein Tco_0444373, partial [Tanacetum coccineum]
RIPSDESKSGRSRSELVKDPEPPCVPPTKKQVDDLFQWFDDDEVVPIPPVIPRSFHGISTRSMAQRLKQ